MLIRLCYSRAFPAHDRPPAAPRAGPAIFLPMTTTLYGIPNCDTVKKARTWLAEHGYDPVYGARPLKRVIQRSVENPLSLMVLEGSVSDGSVVNISAGEGGLIIDGKNVKTDGGPSLHPMPPKSDGAKPAVLH